LDANTKPNGAAFLREVVEVFPYQIHRAAIRRRHARQSRARLTDNGMAFADLPQNRGRYPEIKAFFGGHIFDRVCDAPCSGCAAAPSGASPHQALPPPPQAAARGPCRRRTDGLPVRFC